MKKYTLYAASAVLVVLYAVSFIPTARHGRKQPAVETVFLNKKYAGSVREIEICRNGSKLLLSRDGGTWVGAFSDSADGTQSPAYFPADRTVVARTIENLQKPVTLYKTAEKRSDGSYGLSEDSAVTISYRTEEGVHSEIAVGGTDFSRSFRYISVSGQQAVYRTSFDFAELLHAEPNFWYDPYIIPRSLLDSRYSDIQKIKISSDSVRRTYIPSDSAGDRNFLELRHGAVCSEIPFGKPVLTLDIEFGASEFLTVSFCRIDAEKDRAGEYVVSYHHSRLDYAFFVSGWTFRRVCETLGIPNTFYISD